MSCFYFCLFLLIFVFKVLGSLEMILVAHGQARHGLIPHLKQHGVCSDSSDIQKEKWQIAPAW